MANSKSQPSVLIICGDYMEDLEVIIHPIRLIYNMFVKALSMVDFGGF